MRRLAPRLLRASATLFATFTVFTVFSCGEAVTAPKGNGLTPVAATLDAVPFPTLVISQVYGGGGNAGSIYKNDFIEIFNPGSAAVSLSGWSVQYASAAGTSWAATPLSGSIPPGGYYLVQEGPGAGGTTALPTPDASGTLALAAASGKVILASQAAALPAGACPTGATVIDVVSFGAGNCGPPAPGPNTSNQQSDQRGNGGCTYSANPAVDFVAALAAPRNARPLPIAAQSPAVSPRRSRSSPIRRASWSARP